MVLQFVFFNTNCRAVFFRFYKRENMKICKRSKQERGITLIALVVTIIVLLILAGVTITAVLGNNGIIQKAKQATQIHQNAVITENNDMNNASDFIDDLNGEDKWWLPTEAELAELQAANASAMTNMLLLVGSDTQNATISNIINNHNTNSIAIIRETEEIWLLLFIDNSGNEQYCFLTQKDLRSMIKELEKIKQQGIGMGVDENFLAKLNEATQVPVWINDYSYSISYECPLDLDEIKYYASESYYNRVMSHIRSAIAN